MAENKVAVGKIVSCWKQCSLKIADVGRVAPLKKTAPDFAGNRHLNM
jgi:hypothetical protein